MPLGENMDLSDVLERKLEEALDPEEKISMLTKIFLQLDASYKLQKQLNSFINLDELLIEGMAAVASLLKITEYILLLREGETIKTAAASARWKEQLSDVSIKVGDGFLGKVAQKGQAEVISDLAAIEDPRSIYHQSLKPLNLPKIKGSLLCMPIVEGKGNASGVLIIVKSDIDAFDDITMSFFSDLAEELGKTIQRARKFKTTKEMAVVDEMTGLHNRKFFISNIEKELARAARYGHVLSLGEIMWDGLNGNAMNGIRERLLKNMGGYVQKRFRKSDLTARYRDDSFAFIFPQTSKGDLEKVMISLSEELNGFIEDEKLNGVKLFYGLASYPEDGSSAKSLTLEMEKHLADMKLKDVSVASQLGTLGKYLKRL